MMERLTERVGDGIRYDNGKYIVTCYPKNDNLTPVDKLAAKLCDLEDKIENGEVIVLPCKVGDTLYYCIDLGNIVHGQVLEIKVLRIEIQDKMRFYAKTVKHYRYNYTWFESTDIGKTVFLTRDEAEKALA